MQAKVLRGGKPHSLMARRPTGAAMLGISVEKAQKAKNKVYHTSQLCHFSAISPEDLTSHSTDTGSATAAPFTIARK